jgi:hypothetical protein
MKIKTKTISKRCPVYAYQARFLAKTIRRLEGVFVRQLGETSELTLEEFRKFQRLEEYQSFMEAALVCGFVCDDFKQFFPLEHAHSRPNDVLLSLPFQKLRHYVHTLQRTEKWCSEYSTALYESLKIGALSIVARRLDSDPSIYESNVNDE